MQIELFYFSDCPSYQTAAENLKKALQAEGLADEFKMTPVLSEEDAIQKRFPGSPTIRIDGVDLEGSEAEASGYGYGCRVYSTDGCMAGWPSVEQIRSALRERLQSREAGACQELFTVDLQFQPGMEPVTSPVGRLGQLIASGDGWARGPRVQGGVRWDIYEKTEYGHCAFSIAGIIDTDGGATVTFDTMGYGVAPNTAHRSPWSMAAAGRFSGAVGPYSWLNSTVAVWYGSFDPRTGRHQYRVTTHQTPKRAEGDSDTQHPHFCCR